MAHCYHHALSSVKTWGGVADDYRPGKSAIDAVGKARERCWRYDWVLDLDIKGFFDSID
jgi:hypothetical protein